MKKSRRATVTLPVARQCGFTLVEILTTVLIVGILVAIALPVYARYQNRVRTMQAVQDITVLSAAAQRYWQDARAYPNSLADIGNANRLDPWGRPYVYYNIDANGRGRARKDHALNPLNTDFDLYSLGPDGQSKPQITQQDSLDDIIRASNGKFIGIASSF